MVSIQPITQSYIEESESCFLISPKEYKKGGVMNTLVKYSPLFAFLVQRAFLDDYLDTEQLGSCFVPSMEYCERYFEIFKDVDHLRARQIVLSSLVRARLTRINLQESCELPSVNRYFYISVKNINNTILLTDSNLKIIRSDICCSNGIIHILNGLIDPGIYMI